MWKRFSNSGLVWAWLSVVLIIADQITKQWANDALQFGRIIEVLPHFDFRLAYNYGAAFSLFADGDGWQRYGLSSFSTLVSIALIVWLWRLPKTQRFLSIGLSFVLAGAIGNAIDRVYYGYVIDFIDWYVSKNGYHWPTFNIADVAVSIGAVMLIIDSIWFADADQQKPTESRKS